MTLIARDQLYHLLIQGLPQHRFNFIQNIRGEKGDQETDIGGYPTYQEFITAQLRAVQQLSKVQLSELIKFWKRLHSLSLLQLDHRGNASTIDGFIFDSDGKIMVVSGGDDLEDYAEWTGRTKYYE